jgi:hypothetical protein
MDVIWLVARGDAHQELTRGPLLAWGRWETRQHRRVIRVTERSSTRTVRLLVPDIAIEGCWTSLGECVCADTKVFALYSDHATPEQFHSEFKTDLDIERLRQEIRHQRSGHGVRCSRTISSAGSGSKD